MIKYIHPIDPAAAQGLVAEVYAQINRDFGRIVEPFRLHSPLPKLLAGSWIACRETELVGAVPRTVKEVVAAAVSMLNQCSFCADAHTIMLNSTGDRPIADAIGKAHYEKIPDPAIKAIAEWALATLSPGCRILSSPPFSQREAPEIIGTAVFYHYINRVATIFLGDTPLPSSRAWLEDPLKRFAGLMFRRSVRRLKTPGESLDLLPPADLPEYLKWMEINPTVAGGFARFVGAIQDIEEIALSYEARKHVFRIIDRWTGEAANTRNWIEDEIGQLDEAQESAIRLSLLAALSPNQIDGEDVLNFRKYFPGDTGLLGTIAWASFTAAMKICKWIQFPSPAP